jgi:hypothetical protein
MLSLNARRGSLCEHSSSPRRVARLDRGSAPMSRNRDLVRPVAMALVGAAGLAASWVGALGSRSTKPMRDRARSSRLASLRGIKRREGMPGRSRTLDSPLRQYVSAPRRPHGAPLRKRAASSWRFPPRLHPLTSRSHLRPVLRTAARRTQGWGLFSPVTKSCPFKLLIRRFGVRSPGDPRRGYRVPVGCLTPRRHPVSGRLCNRSISD